MPEQSIRLTRAMRLLQIDADSPPESLADALWLAHALPAPVRGREKTPKGSDEEERSTAETEKSSSKTGLTGTLSGSAGSGPVGKRAGIYAPEPVKANDRGLPATLVTVPAGEALPHRLLLERALKPFLRRYPSRRLTVLDELATAEVSAERQNATPVYSPAPERWFDIAMLVEDSDAMSVWAETIRELHGLFERHGAFRQVRMWMYTVRGGEFMLSTAAGQPALPHVVADPEGRRLCLFLTDGTSSEWRKAPLVEFARNLGQACVVAILQMLPRRAWPHTALGDAMQSVQTLNPGTPNALMQSEDPFSALVERVPDAGYAPMFTLEPDHLAAWARFVMSSRRSLAAAARLEPRDTPKSVVEKELSVDPEQLVAKFRSIASPEAFQLLRLLAAAPLTLPIMRLVQRSMPGRREQVHLAEILLSGLIHRVTPIDAKLPTEQIFYDFVPGVRELLNDTLSSREALRTDDAMRPAQERLREFVEQQTGRAIRDFRALLADPQGMERLPASARPFVEVSRRIYERRGILPASSTRSDHFSVPDPLVPQKATLVRKAKVSRRVLLIGNSPGLTKYVGEALMAAGHDLLDSSMLADYVIQVGESGPRRGDLVIDDRTELPGLLNELDRIPPGKLYGFPPELLNAIPRPDLESLSAGFLLRIAKSPGMRAFVKTIPMAGSRTFISAVLRRLDLRRAFPGGIYWDTLPPQHRGTDLCLVVLANSPFVRISLTAAAKRWVILTFSRVVRSGKWVTVGYLTNADADRHLRACGAGQQQIIGIREIHKNVPLLVAMLGGALKRNMQVSFRSVPSSLEDCFESLVRRTLVQMPEATRTELIRFAAFQGGDPSNPLIPGPESDTMAAARDFGWLAYSHYSFEYRLTPYSRQALSIVFPEDLKSAHEFICRYYEEQANEGPLKKTAYWPHHLISHAKLAGGTARVEALLRRPAVLGSYLLVESKVLLRQISMIGLRNAYLKRLRDQLNSELKSRPAKFRWAVRTASDPDAHLVGTVKIPTTVEELARQPRPAAIPDPTEDYPQYQNRRVPGETIVYEISADIISFRLQRSGNYTLVLRGRTGQTIRCNCPNPDPRFVRPESRWAIEIAIVRAQILGRWRVSQTMQEILEPVRLSGIAFFNQIHGQTGMSPNGLELTPILSITWLSTHKG